MLDVFYTLHREGKLKAGEKRDVADNMDALVVQLAQHDAEFQKYLDTEGGLWKKRKYDTLYYLVSSWTEKYVAHVNVDKTLSPVKFSKEDERQLLGSENGNNEEQYQASNELTEQRDPEDKVDDKSLDSESQKAMQSQMDISFSMESPAKTA